MATGFKKNKVFGSENIRAVRNLVIIEAVGKIKALEAALKRCGLDDFQVLATSGHLFDSPESFNPVAIDRYLKETNRVPRNLSLLDTIIEWSEKAQRVLIATDADQEGDVIASDLFQLVIPEHPNVWRVRLRALDAEGVALAFSRPEPLQVRDAWPGVSRRMLDRLIAASHSVRDEDFVDADALEVAVGRIQSALLGAASKEVIPYGEATLVLPCCDKKDPFVTVIPVTRENHDQVMELIERCKEFERDGRCVPFGAAEPAEDFKPWNYSEAVLSVSQATNRSIEEVARSLQNLYENGRMSYPRSAAQAVTAEALGAMQEIASMHGARFDPGRLPHFTRQSRHSHESPRPLDKKIDISSPIMLMSPDDATLSLISRNLLAAGQPHALHKPDVAALPAWARDLGFQRKFCQWLRPWPRRQPTTQFRAYPAEEVAMRLLMKHQLGRPSTQVSHAAKFASRNLLDERMELTQKARNWIEKTPAILLDPKTSSRIERILDESADARNNQMPPQELVRVVLESMGMWDKVQSILEAPAVALSNGLGRSNQKTTSDAGVFASQYHSN